MAEQGRCKDCRHWNQAADYHRPDCDGPLGACGAVNQAPETQGGWSSFVPVGVLAVTQDAENYASLLYTRPDFGCVLFEPAMPSASEPDHQSK
jgi:hypothetical protein